MCQLYAIKEPEWLRKNLSSEEKVLRKKKKYIYKQLQTKQPNFVVEWLALLLRIRDVSGSNLGPKTTFPV
jgi:hypothetical protein